jgi:beta-glucanase (GH16 family)
MGELSIAVFVLHILMALQSVDGFGTVYNELVYDNTRMMETADWANGGFFDCIFQADNISFDNGEMTLKLDTYEGSSYFYSGAEYRTKDVYGYGLYLVSMKPVKNSGVVSSFFTYTGEANKTVWDEIDIEFLGKDTTLVQFNFFANGEGDHEYIYDLGYDASLEFHEYGFLWLENSISWLVDGEIVYQVTSKEYTLPKTPGQIMMNVWNGTTEENKIRDWLGSYDGAVPLEAKYDYFKYIPWNVRTTD